MNEFIIPNSNSVSNDFNYSRTDLDAQEQQIAEFIKKGGKVINLNKEQTKKMVCKAHACRQYNPNAKIRLLLSHLQKTGEHMTSAQIKKQFGIKAAGSAVSRFNQREGKTLIKNKKLRDSTNHIYCVYYAAEVN